jgi:integrase
MSASKVKTTDRGIYKRGGRYVYIYRDLDGKQRQGSARTMDEARKARRGLIAKVDVGDYIAPTKETVAEYLREWIETYDQIRPNTREDYRANIENRLIPKIGQTPLTRLRKADILALISWLHDDEAQGQHLSDSSVKAIVGTLSSALTYAVQIDKISANPRLGIKIKARDRAHAIKAGTDTTGERLDQQARILTEEQTADLIEAMPDRYRDLIRLLDVTGFRISEALALKWGDLRLSGQPRVFVNRMVTDNPDRKPGDPWWHFQEPKSAAGFRDVPIPESLAADLLSAKDPRAADDELAFQTRTGAPIDQHNLRRDFDKAAKAAGVGWAGFHALRHTCASRLFAAGMNPKQIAKWLGHSDAAFTLRTYVHLMPDDAPAALPESAQGVSKVSATGRFEGVPTDTATLPKAA